MTAVQTCRNLRTICALTLGGNSPVWPVLSFCYTCLKGDESVVLGFKTECL
jgi:hypothetical protein